MAEEEKKNQSLIEFINENQNWKDILKEKPFRITIREKDDYVLLKYNQFDTDMSYKISQQCRGCILKRNEDGVHTYVCRPFDKFFNYGEPLAAEIDWKTARVKEKVDGSLIKLWHDNAKWHLSTNGIIDAFSAPAGEKETTFGEIFERAIGTDIRTLGSTLDMKNTYMFELTSPETQVVIPYPDGVYYLACRETKTGNEIFDLPVFDPKVRIRFPKSFKIDNLDDVISAAQMMSRDEEGFVVNDEKGTRIKVKSPEYLIAAHMQVKGAMTDKRIFKMIKNDCLDDFLSFAPESIEKANRVLAAINDFCQAVESEWETVVRKDITDQKEFAMEVRKSKIRGYLFGKRKTDELTAREWLLKISVKSALDLISPFLNKLDA